MVRTKLIAVLLGPSGVGLVSVYTAITDMMSTFAGFGIGSSGVRQVAEAHATGNPAQLVLTMRVVRQLCWATGLLGWLVMLLLARPLSNWVFGSAEHTWALRILGCTLLLGSVSAGQKALLQGLRRIGDLARFSVWSVLWGTVAAVAVYSSYGAEGIVAVLVVTAAINLVTSWWYARKAAVSGGHLEMAERWRQMRTLVGLGTAFMWSTLLVSVVALVTRSLVVRQLGLEAGGIYQAAWGISGMFAGFILTAMSADFYPRLSSVAQSHPQMNQLVNEQTEVGILLALPGIVATLNFAPALLHVFYSTKFLAAADLLPWFALGIFGRVLSWPSAFIVLAKGAACTFALMETGVAVAQMVFVLLGLHWFGIAGAALAFTMTYAVYTLTLLLITRWLVGFRWNYGLWRLIGITGLLILGSLALHWQLRGWAEIATGLLLTGFATWVSLQEILRRLGPEHRIVALITQIPGIRRGRNGATRA
jgi:PST family polysaccharide transporter